MKIPAMIAAELRRQENDAACEADMIETRRITQSRAQTVNRALNERLGEV